MASQRTTASLLLINNPSIKLAHNKGAPQIYNQQFMILNQNIDHKKDVIESEKNLQHQMLKSSKI